MRINNFDEFVHPKAARTDASQYDYLKNINNKLGVDVVLKQETPAQDFNKSCIQLAIQCQLSHYNTTQKRNPTASYFSEELNQFVNNHWHKDIQLFGYQSPIP